MLRLFKTILIYFKCILNYPWLYLASDEDTKNTNRDIYIIAINIGNTYAINICISSIYAIGIWIRYASIRDTYIRYIYAKNFFIKDVELKILARLEVILTNLKINNCFF